MNVSLTHEADGIYGITQRELREAKACGAACSVFAEYAEKVHGADFNADFRVPVTLKLMLKLRNVTDPNWWGASEMKERGKITEAEYVAFDTRWSRLFCRHKETVEFMNLLAARARREGYL